MTEDIATLLRDAQAYREGDIAYLHWKMDRPARVPKGTVTPAYREGWDRLFGRTQ